MEQRCVSLRKLCWPLSIDISACYSLYITMNAALPRKYSTVQNACFSQNRSEQNMTNFIKCRTKFNKAKAKFKHNEDLKISKLAKSNPKSFWKKINKFVRKKTNQIRTLCLLATFLIIFQKFLEMMKIIKMEILIQTLSFKKIKF